WHVMGRYAGNLGLHQRGQVVLRRRFCLTMMHSLLFAAACASGPGAVPMATLTPSVPQAPSIPELWVIDVERASPAEQALALTLQGLVNKKAARIWIASDGMNALILDQLRKEGTRVQTAGSVWDLLRQFRDEVSGAIVYTLGTDSINVATALCGPKQAVAVDESILDRIKAEGLTVLMDVRDYDERRAFDEFNSLFARGIAVEQIEDKTAHLRDFAVFKNAFTYYRMDPGTTTHVVQALGPNTRVFGWGGDEHHWIQTLSKGGGTGIPADWSRNLSVLAQLPAKLAPRPHRSPEAAKDGERIVAFVMSDGDNIQWMGGGFVSDQGFWASPQRGTFNMTWEMAPVLAEVAPRVLDYFYRTASRGPAVDDFVTGPSGIGYSFHNNLPDRKAFAEQTASALRMSDLSIVTMLNSGGDMAQASELLERPEVLGVLYKDYNPYNARKGEIFWHNGKPAVSYRFLLWEPLRANSPEGVAEAIGQMPALPLSDPNSCAIINVHAWSFKDIGGPMVAVKQTIDRLPQGTRVVTAEELITLLRNQFGTPVSRGK
ncbi:MAG: hypothetical protein M1546_19660, partial [Chloroflexi bacterium]|nr:hypothetical protein [Chloroflexota bacterium]